MIKKLKNINFIIAEDVAIDEVFVFNKASSSEENYKYFIGYKIRPFCTIRLLPVRLLPVVFVYH